MRYFLMRVIIVLAAFLICIRANAQINIFNLSLSDSTKRIAYAGVENFLGIKGGKTNDNIKMFTSLGDLTKIDASNFILKVPMADSFFITVQRNGTQVLRETFKSDVLNEPTLRLGGIKDSVASIQEILINPFLHLFIPGSLYKKQFVVTGFNAIFISDDLDSLRTYSVGNLLSNEQQELTKKLKPGNKILFDQIYAFGPDSRRRKFKSFIITIR